MVDQRQESDPGPERVTPEHSGVLDSIRAAHGLSPRAKIDLEEGSRPDESSEGEQTPRYAVGGEIARGGMGAIYRVRDQELRRSLAMKVLMGRAEGKREPDAPVDADDLHRFLEEAQITAQLAHPGVVPVHELGMDAQGRVFFTMDLVRGQTLGEIIELARAKKDGWSRPRALQIILRVCETLAYAHDKGVIHRDIKPENIMVGRFGETYVMDWGLAKVLGVDDPPEERIDPAKLSMIRTERADFGSAHDSPLQTVAGDVIGTPAYMPPEQARGVIEDVDKRSDVYSIGALLYELLTGCAPFTEPGKQVSPGVVLVAVHMGPPKPVREFEPTLPDEIIAICEKAMAREPEERYATAEELASDIQAFIEGRVVGAYRTGPVVELRKWIGRNRALAASIAAAVFIAVAGSIWFAIYAGMAAEEIGVERDKEHAARVRAEGLRLSARAGNEGTRLPALALGLAIEGARRADDPYGRTALYRALSNLHEIATLEGHSTYSSRVGFDATGKRLVSVSGMNGEVIVWDLATRQPLHRMGGDATLGPDFRRDIAITASRNRVATSGNDKKIRIWDTVNGRSEQVLETGAVVSNLAWDRAGERLAVVTQAGRLRVWQPPAEEFDFDLELGANGDHSVAWRHDGARIAVQRPDGSVTIRDVATGAEIAELPSHADGPDEPSRNSRVAWLDEGRLLLSWRDDPVGGWVKGRAEIWDLSARRRVAAFGAAGGGCSIPIWNASRSTIAMSVYEQGENTGRVVIWDAAERRERCRLKGPCPLWVYALSPNGDHVVTASIPGGQRETFVLWDARTGEIRAHLRGHTYHLFGAAVTNDGLVATASADTTVRLWRGTSPVTFEGTAHWDMRKRIVHDLFADFRRALVTVNAPERPYRTECLSVPDGRTLYALPAHAHAGHLDRARNRLAYHDPETNRVHVLDALDGRPIHDFPGMSEADPDEKIHVSVSPDGSRIALKAKGNRIEIRDADDGSPLGEIETGLEYPKWGIPHWSPDGRSILLSGGMERVMLEYDVATGSLLRRFEGGHTGFVTHAAVSPSGKWIATGAADRSVILWDRETASIEHRFTGFFMGDLWVFFDPTERFIVVRTVSDTMTLLDVERREVFAEVPTEHLGFTMFDRSDVIVASMVPGHGVRRIPLDPVAAANSVRPRPLSLLELSNFDVGNAEERTELVDEYVAWTHAPNRIVYVALEAAAKGDLQLSARYLERIEAIAPDAPEGIVVQAALQVGKGDSSAALAALMRALDAGCNPRALRHRVFDGLRETPGWQAIADRLVR